MKAMHILGRAVKMFAKKVSKVLVGFEDTKKRLENAKNVVVTGTPTKVKKINLTYTEKMKILTDAGINMNLPIVLIFGGSQGAQKINEAVYDLIKNNCNKKYQIVWATGQKQYDIINEKFNKENIDVRALKNVKILPYIYNMTEMMNVADLLICRSGAMTITEISIVGKPAIFIPLPSKMANRQEDNARVLEKIGAAKIILNDEINADALKNQIDSIIENGLELIKMGKRAESLAPCDVENKIYTEICNVTFKK
jgi:UDP-N-acetylglucosamine--N-acetylmuramyl-(pentapeptide) pyrophosphoryl-undecaprenol N-acetylglucosamine transferase